VFWDAVDVPEVVVDVVEGTGTVEDAAGVSEALLAFLGRLPCPERPALEGKGDGRGQKNEDLHCQRIL
jgi:hypothetical protein